MCLDHPLAPTPSGFGSLGFALAKIAALLRFLGLYSVARGPIPRCFPPDGKGGTWDASKEKAAPSM